MGISRAKCSDEEEMISSENEYIDNGYGFGLKSNKNSNQTVLEND